MPTHEKDTLDVITIGRSSVDLYGQQVGGRLEDMASFAKYIGGSPTNIAAGSARLGLKSALITRVGDEHMGRFIREQLAKEGVNTDGVATDPERLTALVLLGIGAIIFAVVKQLTSDSEPEPYEPAGTNNSSS